jgi:DNA-binding LytR/AlgR family response regulator
MIRETMAGMEKKLPSDRFVRIHRSSIVCIPSVREIKPYFHGDYIVYLKDGRELKLSRRYWPKVEQVLGG